MPEAALYPGARWHPLGAQTETRMRSHDIVCLHTMVGYLASTDRYFRITNGAGYRGTESHFGVGGPWGPDLGGRLDGASWQWQDLAFKADANLDGWDRVVSIETADNAPALPGDIAAWSPAQVDEIVDLVDWLCSPAAHARCPAGWLCRQVGIPRQLIPDTKPGRRGIGYHAQGVPGVGLVPGGEQWSNARGKVCPGARRIAQLKTVIVPRVAARALGPIEEDDMAAVPQKEWDEVHRWTGAIGQRVPTNLPGQLDELRAEVKAIRAEIEQIPAPAVYVKVPPAAEVYQVRDGRARHVTAEEWALIGSPDHLVKRLDPAKDTVLLGQLGIAAPAAAGGAA